MTFQTAEDGPCSCPCHDNENCIHIVPCCAYTYQQRAEAEAAALKRNIARGGTNTGDES